MKNYLSTHNSKFEKDCRFRSHGRKEFQDFQTLLDNLGIEWIVSKWSSWYTSFFVRVSFRVAWVETDSHTFLSLLFVFREASSQKLTLHSRTIYSLCITRSRVWFGKSTMQVETIAQYSSCAVKGNYSRNGECRTNNSTLLTTIKKSLETAILLAGTFLSILWMW
jgi:hypothetical protein